MRGERHATIAQEDDKLCREVDRELAASTAALPLAALSLLAGSLGSLRDWTNANFLSWTTSAAPTSSSTAPSS